MARHRPEIKGFDPAKHALLSAEPSARERRQAKRAGVVEAALRSMRSKMSDPELTLSDIAEEIHYTERAIQRAFHTLDSEGFRFELRKMRMEQAEKLLRGDKKISEIAREVGYIGPMHFSKAFKRHTGLSPRQWRALKSEERAEDLEIH